MDDAEVEPQVDDPEDLEAEMDELQAEPEEQEDAEEPQGGFMFGGIPWTLGGFIIGV